MPFIKSQKIWKRKKGFLQLHVGEFEENDVKNIFNTSASFLPKKGVVKYVLVWTPPKDFLIYICI